MTPSHSLKREMKGVGEDCGMQPVTIAMAFVYFEKLVLQGRLNKQNRYFNLLSSCKLGMQPDWSEVFPMVQAGVLTDVLH